MATDRSIPMSARRVPKRMIFAKRMSIRLIRSSL